MNDLTPIKETKSDRTRARIRKAAFECFARDGYARAGLRDIAEIVDIAPSLIVRHFGSKANLFRSVLIEALGDSGMASYDKANFGRQVARHISHADHGRLTAMIILAVADPESKEVAQQVCREIVIDTMAEWLGGQNGRSRAIRTLILTNGFVVQTRHMMAEEVPEELVDWLARSIQAIFDEE